VTGLEHVSYSSLSLPSASAWDTPDVPVVKTGHWIHSSIYPFGLTSHFKDYMEMTTRDAFSVVGTANHEDFFEPWSCTSMHQQRSLESRHTPTTPHITLHLAVDGTKKPHPGKATKKKHPRLGIFLFKTNHVVIQNLYRSSTSIFVSIYSIQARRTGFAALKWPAISGERRV